MYSDLLGHVLLVYASKMGYIEYIGFNATLREFRPRESQIRRYFVSKYPAIITTAVT